MHAPAEDWASWFKYIWRVFVDLDYAPLTITPLRMPNIKKSFYSKL